MSTAAPPTESDCFLNHKEVHIQTFIQNYPSPEELDNKHTQRRMIYSEIHIYTKIIVVALQLKYYDIHK